MFRKITKRLRRIILSAMTFATASILMVGCGAGEALRNLTVTATTYDKRTKGVNNIPLTKNPNPKDKEQAYVRPKLTQKKAKEYGKKLDGLGLSAEDKKTVWELIERLRTEKKK